MFTAFVYGKNKGFFPQAGKMALFKALIKNNAEKKGNELRGFNQKVDIDIRSMRSTTREGVRRRMAEDSEKAVPERKKGSVYLRLLLFTHQQYRAPYF